MRKPKKVWNALGKDTRFFVITGGRGSGKSFEVNRFIALLTFEEGHKVLFTRHTMTSAKMSIIPEFQEKIELLGLEGYFTVLKSDVVNVATGSEVLFRGIKTSSGDQTANLKSLQGITTWVIDEAEELTSEETFDKINLSIRKKGIQNRVILILNPATKEHWIYKRFFESEGVQEGFSGTKGNITYIHTTYKDNEENLGEDYLNEINRIKASNPEKYKHVILGGWMDKAEGVVFTDWTFGTFNPDGLQTSCGMDFGFSVDPDTLVEVAIDKSKRLLYVKEHIYQKGIKTPELAHMIKSRIANKLVIADSAEPRLIADLKHLGVNIQAVKKGTIESGVARMQDFKIIVDPDSQNLAKELNNYRYKDKGSQLYVDDYNHGLDSIRYNVTFHLDNPNKGNYLVY